MLSSSPSSSLSSGTTFAMLILSPWFNLTKVVDNEKKICWLLHLDFFYSFRYTNSVWFVGYCTQCFSCLFLFLPLYKFCYFQWTAQCLELTWMLAATRALSAQWEHTTLSGGRSHAPPALQGTPPRLRAWLPLAVVSVRHLYLFLYENVLFCPQSVGFTTKATGMTAVCSCFRTSTLFLFLCSFLCVCFF
jgi:hypothetical protein